MIRIPPSAFALGFAGLIPFLWGALLSVGYAQDAGGGLRVALPGDGPLLLVRYGGIILPFMAGVLWGFATKATGPRATAAYALSVVPALWWFFSPGTNAPDALINLMIGYTGLLILDFAYYRWGLAPNWWMHLRVPLTVVVVVCLGIGAWT